MLRRFKTPLTISLFLVDSLLLLISLSLADLIRHRLVIGEEIAPETIYLTPSIYIMVVVLWVFFSRLNSIYDIDRLQNWNSETRAVAWTVTLAVLFMASAFYMLKIEDFSRLLFAYFYGISLASLLSIRIAGRLALTALQDRGLGTVRVLIVGTTEMGQETAKALKTRNWSGIELVGFVDDRISNGIRVLGPISDTARLVSSLQIDEVIIALPSTRRQDVIDLILDLQLQPVRLKIVPDLLEMVTIRATIEDLSGIPLIGLRDPVLSYFDSIVKRVVDIAVSMAALIVVWPVILLTAILIKFDSPGPILFIQERVGENGKPFRMYKFRSMVTNAEELLPKLIDLSKLTQPAFKIANDPRVTRIGRFIRRTSIDELPQLWNVFVGDMSLVGPRPEESKVVQMYNSWQAKRLAVKPGLTGPMQVNGRGDLPLDERVKLELAYIENYSIWEDLKILVQTVPVVFSGKGSH